MPVSEAASPPLLEGHSAGTTGKQTQEEAGRGEFTGKCKVKKLENRNASILKDAADTKRTKDKRETSVALAWRLLKARN